MKHEFPEYDSWYAHRVSYGETDQMGILYYGEYLHLFERARSQFIRERGMSYAEVEARDILLPVREACVRYRAPSRFDDLIYIHTGVSEWKRASMTFVYEVMDEAKQSILVTGHTQHALVGRDFKPTPVPEWLKEMLDK